MRAETPDGVQFLVELLSLNTISYGFLSCYTRLGIARVIEMGRQVLSRFGENVADVLRYFSWEACLSISTAASFTRQKSGCVLRKFFETDDTMCCILLKELGLRRRCVVGSQREFRCEQRFGKVCRQRRQLLYKPSLHAVDGGSNYRGSSISSHSHIRRGGSQQKGSSMFLRISFSYSLAW